MQDCGLELSHVTGEGDFWSKHIANWLQIHLGVGNGTPAGDSAPLGFCFEGTKETCADGEDAAASHGELVVGCWGPQGCEMEVGRRSWSPPGPVLPPCCSQGFLCHIHRRIKLQLTPSLPHCCKWERAAAVSPHHGGDGWGTKEGVSSRPGRNVSIEGG